MKFILAGAGLFAFIASSAPQVQVADADQCRQQCQAIENQCRIKSRDLNSSECSARLIACLANCKTKR